MKRKAIIKKFTEILFQASEASNTLEDVNKSLSAFENFVNSNKVLKSILQSKRLSYDQRDNRVEKRNKMIALIRKLKCELGEDI